MNEKDRMIVTFGNDTNESTPAAPDPGTGFTLVDPPAEPDFQTGLPDFDYAAPDADDTDYSVYDDLPLGSTDSSYSVSADQQALGLNDDAGELIADGGNSGNGGDGGNGDDGSSYYGDPVPAPKDPRYVTKSFLVICMVICIVVSSVLGTLAGGYLYRNSNGSTSRDDSKLTELELGDSDGSEMSVKDIIKKNENAVVEIVVSGTRQGLWGQLELTEGAGSGVIVSEDGYIATNHHVIDGANKVQVTLHNGDQYSASIIGSDAANDIAVIKIDAKDLTVAEIGDSSKVEVGDMAIAIGNPLGQLGGTATKGIISALDRNLTIEGTTLTLLQTDAAINGGNSGGGLFNSQGELIGIVESKASAVGVEGLAFALPINSVAEIINDFIENGGKGTQKSGTPAIGITISDVSEENAQYYNLESAGVYVAQVTGENAQKAGFQEGDRIISINGKEVKDSSEFISLVRKNKVGDTVTVVVSRNGQQLEIKTVLEELLIEQ